jgi:hypothetical protein
VKKRGGRVTPKGTRPYAIRANQEEVMALLRSQGFEPKAPPWSGRCMVCGKDLDPAVDKDESVCTTCFPPDMKEEWEGKRVDYTEVDLENGGVRELKVNPN